MDSARLYSAFSNGNSTSLNFSPIPPSIPKSPRRWPPILLCSSNLARPAAAHSRLLFRHDSGNSTTKIVPDGKPHKFEAKNKQFLIDGEPTLLIAGEMHFGRILPEDFEARVKQAKAMGLNALSFYLFWNLF